VLESPWTKILAACAFLLVLAALLVVRVWLPPTFNGIDPERQVSMRNKLRKEPSESTNRATNLDSHEIASIWSEGAAPPSEFP